MKWVLEPGMMLAVLATSRTGLTDKHTPVLRLENAGGAPTLWCLRDYWTGTSGEWVISSMPMPGLGIAGKELEASDTSYCGLPWFRVQIASVNPGVFFFSQARGKWIYRPDKTSPEEPFAAIWLDGETWRGDAWYECPRSRFSFANEETELEPAGTLLNDEDADSVAATTWWPRWIRIEGSDASQAPAGVYQSAPGAQLSPYRRAIGVPVWKDQNDTFYPRSLEMSGSRYTYGTIAWDPGRAAYVLGDASSDWFESADPPTIGGAARFVNKTFNPVVRRVENGKKKTLVLWFHHYALGGNTETRFLAEVVPWRW